MKNIVLFGGSFDPIHNGHINMALEAQKALGGPSYCEIIFIPNRVSVWKEQSIDPIHKINMISLAIKSYRGFSLSTFELDSFEENYTHITVEHFNNIYKDDANLFLLIGQDQVESFHKWKNVDDIVKRVQVIFYRREKNKEPDKTNIDKYRMIEIKHNKIYEVSSFEMRGLHNLDTPKIVLSYIQDNNLYYIPKIASYVDEKRFEHLKSVALLCYDIALNNKKEDPEKYYVAGLLHDIGKNIDEKTIKMVEEQFSDYLPIDKKLYHQFLSAEIAIKEFNIKDEDILQAIRFHATGKANMNSIAKVVYAADKIDPLRGYDSINMIMAMMNNIDEGFKYVLHENKKHLLSKGRDIDNKLTNECFECYL